jgi:hypothetical protein
MHGVNIQKKTGYEEKILKVFDLCAFIKLQLTVTANLDKQGKEEGKCFD